MQVTVTARHCEVTEAVRQRARSAVTRLAQRATRPHDASVVFWFEHARARVEIRLHTTRGRVHVATGEGATTRTALDRAAARVRHQLDKSARRPVRRRRAVREVA